MLNKKPERINFDKLTDWYSNMSKMKYKDNRI